MINLYTSSQLLRTIFERLWDTINKGLIFFSVEEIWFKVHFSVVLMILFQLRCTRIVREFNHVQIKDWIRNRGNVILYQYSSCREEYRPESNVDRVCSALCHACISYYRAFVGCTNHSANILIPTHSFPK